jgi:glucan phosphoethanolaminetransferase (alkaline phosphatase superfamily)
LKKEGAETMWWIYVLVALFIEAYALLSPLKRRAVIIAVFFIVNLIIHFTGTQYLGMLYASAQKDLAGNIVWTIDLADRVNSTITVLYANVVALVVNLFIALWTLYAYFSKQVERW